MKIEIRMKKIRMKEGKCAAVFLYLISVAVTYQLPVDCNILNTVLICQQSIPRELPLGIQNVYITDYNNGNIGQGRFAHSSWRFVKQFDINANVEISLYIYDHVFVGLRNITTLGIHARKGNVINDKAFVGIDHVEKLDLSNMINLEVETLTKPLLYDGVLPNLRILILENVNTEFNDHNFNVSRSFLQMLKSRNISELSLRGTNLFLGNNANAISTRVQTLDISNVSLSFVNGFRWDIMFPYLKFLNISSIVTRYFSSIRYVNGKSELCRDVENGMLRTIETIYANMILDVQEVYVNNVTYIISEQCVQNIKVLHLRGNNLHFLNATLHLPARFPLYELDMSSNSMTFLSANFLKDMVNLKHLYLGDNLLSMMLKYPDFKVLFKSLQLLKRLSLSYNQLTYIPEHMFLHNLNLQWLDLQGNYLMSTSFLDLQLSNLIFLNISYNRIVYLVGDDLKHLQMITTRNGSKLRGIKMNGNSFECSCESINFIEWINEDHVKNSLQYSCHFGKETTTINDKSIAKARFLCIKTIVYTVSSVLTVMVVLALLITFLLTWRYFRNKRRTNKLKTFLHNFHKGRLHEQFLCLLSYSDSDVEVSTRLFNKVEALLKDITKCERDSVCIDFKHFRAGVPIVEEIVRCMSESFVAVFVVSEAFCQSHWCCIEVREAYEQQKPIILIFAEEVSEEIMTLYVRNIFKRYTRGKLVLTEHGEVEFLPGGMKGLCHSIVLLASEGGRDGGHLQDPQV